ncbi:glycosyl hydrolase [Bacteroidales bacterium]|nr:glycosyl hydrolase [Bacteroidales bacterium]
MKTYTLLLILAFSLNILQAQMLADFETESTSPDFIAEGTTNIVANPKKNSLNPSDSCGYYKKIVGNWHSVMLQFPDTVFFGNSNNLRFLMHCSTVGKVYVKFLQDNIENPALYQAWAHPYNETQPANKWTAIEMDITHLRGKWFTELKIAFAVNNEAEADVYFDQVELIKVIKPTSLFYAVQDANAFLANMTEGTELGEYPAGSKDSIQQAINIANAILDIQDNLSDNEIDRATFDLHDAIAMIEGIAVKHEANLIDTLVSFETVNLYKNLATIAASGHQLFGMHNERTYGVNENGSQWRDDGTASRSNLKDVTGSFGAIASYDAMDIVTKNYAGLKDYRNRLKQNYKAGGVNTICWHMRDPKYNHFYWKYIIEEPGGTYNVVASILEGGEYHEWYRDQLYKLAFFFKGLRGERGEAMPVIFRPFHEHTGSWFWWGDTRCSTAEYNELWHYTVHYLRDTLNVHNLIYAFSPGAGQVKSKDDYYNIFPGDNYMDIYGVDDYFGGSQADIDDLTQTLQYVVELADERNKLPALTETGISGGGINPTDWYTNNLLKAIQGSEKSSKIAYYATWMNYSKDAYFVPYPGHPAVSDFLKFYDDTSTLFLNDLRNLYDSLLDDEVRLPGANNRLFSFTLDNNEGVRRQDTNITILVPAGSELTQLKPKFEVSGGAKVLIGSNEQISGVTPNDFTNPVNYTIISETGESLTEYMVTVNHSIFSKLTISPTTTTNVTLEQSERFSATAYNQFDFPIELTGHSWSVTGGGEIDNTGFFRATDTGTYVVQVKIDTTIATATVIVDPIPVTSIRVFPTSIALFVGDTSQPEVFVYPREATEKRVKWSSSDTNVAKVDILTGEIVGTGKGTATITAKSVNGGFTSSATVTVDTETSISQNNSSPLFNVYPNPFKDELSIYFKDGHNIESASLVNIAGQVVYSEETINGKTGALKIVPEYKSVPSGLYILRLKSATSTEYIKILRE